jgi:hypothetical protein
MHLKRSKSVEISTDTFDIGEFIARMELDSVEACKLIEAYRRARGTDACADIQALCQHLLEKMRPAQPCLVSIEGSTLKAELYDLANPPAAVVTMEGGLIQNIDSNMLMDILVVDFDTDGVDEVDLLKINGDQCTAASWQPVGDADIVRSCFKQYQDSDKACIRT